MSLSPEQVAWVAHLARLDLSAGDQDLMARQLSAILDYVDQLSVNYRDRADAVPGWSGHADFNEELKVL